MDYVLKVVNEYLDGKSNTWGELAHDQAESVFDWIHRETLIRPERIRESSIAEEVYALLLSPVSVRHYASLGTKEAIARAVTLRIRSAVRNSELRGHLVATEIENSDLEVDPEDQRIFGGRYRPAIVESVLEDSDSYPASLSTFRPFEEMPLDWKASFEIPDAVDESPGEQETEHGDEASLGFIDSAVYDAILKNPQLMRSIDWRSFEKLLAQILEEFGYSIDLQRGTKDGGVDIFAIKKDGTFGVEKYLVQAKRWNAAVGVSPVRELAFLHNEYRMTKSCLATTATFTRGAWQLADLHKWTLSLKDFEGLKDWVKDAQEIRHARSFIKSNGGIYIQKK